MSELPRFNVGTGGHVDMAAKAANFNRVISQPVAFNPSHWPPRPTRMCVSVRLGITRMLLERSA